MAKFVIECPNVINGEPCGKYVQATSLWGFVGKNKEVTCACGHSFNVRANLMSSRECPHCGNHVVFDQSKGEKAKCPVCGEPINTMAEQSKSVEFSCAQCGIRLRTARGASTYTCPVCDHENQVAERVANEELKKSGKASVIKYEGSNDALIWKHPIEDFCLGSQLIVDESQEAIFFRDGQALDTFPSGTHTLETQRLPLLDQVYQLPLNNDGVFHTKVYYVNLVTHMGVKWGAGEIHLYEPKYALPVELGLRGTFNIKIVNSRKLLLKVVGTTGALTRDQLMGNNGQGYFQDMVRMQVRSHVAAAIQDNGIDLLDIDRHTIALADALRERLNPALDEYGLEITEFMIAGVQLPSSRAFQDAKAQHEQEIIRIRQEQLDTKVAQAAAGRVTAELNLELLTAQAAAEKLKIQKAAEAEAYRMQAAAEADEMRMKGYTYQQETTRMVGMEAMQNGITGGEGGGMLGGLGDIASLGVQLGAMGSVVNMTKDALNPVMDTAAQMGQAVGGAISSAADTWNCACGNKGITAKCCSECGAKRPEAPALWDCPVCGAKGISGKFCSECGTKRPEAPKPWDCPECGTKGITGKFCSECGNRRPEEATTWNCSCGNQKIRGNFCPECGNKKGE